MTDVFEDEFGPIPEDGAPAPAETDNTADAPQDQPQGEEAPAPAPEAEPAPAAPPPGFVPIQALDARNARIRQLEAEAAQRETPAQPAEQRIPDPVEDPAGFQAYQMQREESIRWQAITSTSQMLANQAHGAETVKAAAEAFAVEVQQRPWLVQELRRQPHPYDWVVNRHQRETALASVTAADLAAFQAWKAAQTAGATTGPTPAAPAAGSPSPTPSTPPRSLASAPAAGAPAAQAAPTGDILDEVFK